MLGKFLPSIQHLLIIHLPTTPILLINRMIYQQREPLRPLRLPLLTSRPDFVDSPLSRRWDDEEEDTDSRSLDVEGHSTCTHSQSSLAGSKRRGSSPPRDSNIPDAPLVLEPRPLNLLSTRFRDRLSLEDQEITTSRKLPKSSSQYLWNSDPNVQGLYICECCPDRWGTLSRSQRPIPPPAWFPI